MLKVFSIPQEILFSCTVSWKCINSLFVCADNNFFISNSFSTLRSNLASNWIAVQSEISSLFWALKRKFGFLRVYLTLTLQTFGNLEPFLKILSNSGPHFGNVIIDSFSKMGLLIKMCRRRKPATVTLIWTKFSTKFLFSRNLRYFIYVPSNIK